MRLIDANLLIYAFDAASPQHQKAKIWLEEVYAEDDLVGLPRVVLLAFMRIVTNPRIMANPASIAVALAHVESLVNHPKSVVMECGPNHWPIFKNLVTTGQVSGPSIADAYLASLAIEHGSTLCSHDSGFLRFKTVKFENPL